MHTYLEWDREALEPYCDYVDGLSLHRYFGNNERDSGGDVAKYLALNLLPEVLANCCPLYCLRRPLDQSD